jgi:hemerythrin superfamily protein
MRDIRDEHTGRGFSFLGGVTAGLIAGHVLAPLLAIAYAQLRVSNGADPFDSLVADHRRFAALLEKMEQNRDAGLLQRSQLLFRLKRGLAAHSMAEENVVYPLLKDEAAAATDARKLYAEHAQIKMLMSKLEREARDGLAWGGELRRLSDLITRHAQQEEDVEFPRLREACLEDQRHALARDIQRERAFII